MSTMLRHAVRPFAFALSLLAAVIATAPVIAHAQFYRLESTVSFRGPAPSWDYLTFEPERSYLYINRRGDGVTVYDVNARSVVRELAQSQRANATVLVPEFDRGYTVNEDGTSTVFRISTLETLERLKIAEAADSGVYEPATRQLVVTLNDNREVAFLDAENGAVVGKLKMPSGKLEFPTPDGRGSLYLAQRDRDVVSRIDARERKVVAEWKTEGCTEPNGLALDSANGRLFVGCRGKGRDPVLAVMDAESGKVITTLAIGRGNDGVIYDAQTRRIYASNGVDGNLVIIQQVDADTYRLAEAPTTRPFARTMALDPRTKKVYLVTAEGTVDPARKINTGPSALYPNRYFADTFTLLTLSPTGK